MQQAYDVIGDVHGQRDTLITLLHRLGYSRDNTNWTTPRGRQLVFVGDIVSKGPDPLGCLALAAELVARGLARAVLGNHEINLIHYLEGLRPRTPATTRQLQPTLDQIQAQPEEWSRLRSFILSLPTHLTLGDGRLRVVHACWPEESLPEIIGEELLQATGPDGAFHEALQNTVKGPNCPSAPYVDRQGRRREEDRVRWWESYPADAPFIAFGHYCFPWTHDEKVPAAPCLLGPGRNAACLDFGAGLGDRLVALRWPEQTFCVVPVQS